MRKILFIYTPIYIALLVVGGCSITRQRSANRQKSATEQTTRHDQQLLIQTANQETSQAKSDTRILETVDTGIVVPARAISSTKSLQEIITGSPIYYETGGQTIEVAYDPARKTMTAVSRVTSQTIPVKITRLTEKKEQANTTQDKKQIASAQSQDATDSETATDNKTINTQLRTHPWPLVLLLAAVAVFAFWLYKRWRRLNPGSKLFNL